MESLERPYNRQQDEARASDGLRTLARIIADAIRRGQSPSARPPIEASRKYPATTGHCKHAPKVRDTDSDGGDR